MRNLLENKIFPKMLEIISLQFSHEHPILKYISTGVGVAAIIGSKESASELGLFLYQQYGPSLPSKNIDEFLHVMKTGKFLGQKCNSPVSTDNLDLISVTQKNTIFRNRFWCSDSSQQVGRPCKIENGDCGQPPSSWFTV